MPLFSRHEIAVRSRDNRFLIRASLCLVAVSAVMAFLISWFSQNGEAEGDPTGEKSVNQILESFGLREPETAAEWMRFLRVGMGGNFSGIPHDCRQLSDKTKWEHPDHEPPGIPEDAFSPETTSLLLFLHEGLSGGKREDAIAGLLALPEALRFRNEALGDLYFVGDKLGLAREAYLREVAHHPKSLYSRRSAVVTALRESDRDLVRSYFAQPDFRDSFATSERLTIRADVRDYRGLVLDTAKLEWEMLLVAQAIPALFVAAIWFLIFMPFWELTRTRVVASLLAFVAGIVSAGFTIFAVMLQERIQGFVLNPEDTPMAQFLYFVVGVGLREEALKLLCFLPLAIWAATRKSDIEGMMLAAMVGLGFAFKENILYLDSSLSSYTAWIRFLTANVLHFSLTGIAGFYLYRMIRRKFYGWEEFLASFIAVVISHGIYNSVISLPSLASYAALSPILVAIMAYRFFDPLRVTMDTVGIGRRISPLGVFVIGSALLTCLVLITSAVDQPYRIALGSFLASVGGMIPLSFAFISRFRDL